jgi:polar amino acid transport system substrate-binding protein
MNRSFARTAVVIFSVILALTVAQAASAQCLTVDKVKAKGGWDIVTEVPDWEPYWFADQGGKFIGMDVDLLNEVNKRLGIAQTRYKPVPWEGVLPAQLSGLSDFLPEAITITEERKKTFAYSHPYGDASIVIMTRPDTGIKTTDDLAGRIVGVQTGSAGEAVALKVQERLKTQGKGFRELKSYQNTSDAFLDLGNRRVDAVLNPRPPVAVYMSKHPGRFAVAGVVDQPTFAAWVFRPADMAGAGCVGFEVNRVLQQLRREGFIAGLQKKWFGHEIPLPDY